MLARIAVSLVFLLPAVGAPSAALAQCPEGKSPVTMVLKNGTQKTLCVSENAVQGIETAAENSSTTIVPAACPEKCLTQTDIEYWNGIGDLQCRWMSGEPFNTLTCVIYGSKYGDAFKAFQFQYSAAVSVCSNVDKATELKVFGEEANACLALIRPYESSGDPCPCQKAYDEFLSSYADSSGLSCSDISYEGYRILSIEAADGNDIFSFYPASKLKQTCGMKDTSLADLTDAQAQGCIEVLNGILAKENLHCSK